MAILLHHFVSCYASPPHSPIHVNAEGQEPVRLRSFSCFCVWLCLQGLWCGWAGLVLGPGEFCVFNSTPLLCWRPGIRQHLHRVPEIGKKEGLADDYRNIVKTNRYSWP